LHNYWYGDKLFLTERKFLIAIAPWIFLSGCMTGPPTGAYCLLCPVDIVSLTSDGGEIGTNSFSESDREKARQLANANCQYRGLGVAILGERDYSRMWRGYYPYRCVRPQPNPTYSAPVNTVPSGVDLTAAREKCKDLGFKQGTETFGNCVLKLSK
jgi:hypothetical protein